MTFLQNVITHYLECALWATTDAEGHHCDTYLDQNYSAFDFSYEAREQAATDCRSFLAHVAHLELEANPRLTAEQIGHDFFLTRNGHGAGFWDRGLGQLGDVLSDVARSFGECHPYPGDDGKLHFQ